jgi:hypothetical protein
MFDSLYDTEVEAHSHECRECGATITCNAPTPGGECDTWEGGVDGCLDCDPMTRNCPACGAEAGEQCRPMCIGRVEDDPEDDDTEED